MTDYYLRFLFLNHTAGDSLNAKHSITDFYTEDAVLQFGNNPLVEARQNLVAMFEKQFALLRRCGSD